MKRGGVLWLIPILYSLLRHCAVPGILKITALLKRWLKISLCFPCSTIGKLEPSYVIRKFLDAQRIHNLTAYLQALHRQSLANADHTTLLLNCYTKLKDSSKLEEFIKVKQLKMIKQAMDTNQIIT